VIDPDLNGQSKIAYVSIWHPTGLTEMMPVGSDTRAWDIATSNSTGLKYFNSFFLDVPAREASFSITKWFRDAELTPTPEQAKTFITISESYCEGTALWNGKEVKFHGHTEQLSDLK
jgi:hypothetical protein